MSAGADVDALLVAFTQLRGALDSDDAGRILKAARDIGFAVERVRSHGAWRSEPALIEKLETLGPLLEAARVRVNMASDDVRRRLAMLADQGGHQAKVTYGR